MSIQKITPETRLNSTSSNPSTDNSAATAGKVNEIIDVVNAITDGSQTITEVVVSNGTAAAPSMTFAAQQDKGVYSAGTDLVDVAVAGAKVAEFSTTGLAVTGAASTTTSITAGTTLAATTSLNVGTDQTFTKEVNHNISVSTTTTAATVGGTLAVTGGQGATSGAGGPLALAGGAGGLTGTGGAVTITTGAGGATSGNSGALTVASGNETGTDQSGTALLQSGTTVSANSGLVTVRSGLVGTSGNSGALTLQSGQSTVAGDSGVVSLKSGNVGTGDSGDAQIVTGNSTVGGTGDITLTTGNTASGLAGDILLTPGTHTSATVSPLIGLNKAVVRKPLSSPVASGATITGPELVGGLIAATGAAGNFQLPSTANITTAIGSTPAGTTFEFYFNASAMTATDTATLLVGANMTVKSAPAITGGGSLTVTQDTQVVGRFEITFDTATTCKISRIS